MILQIYTNFPNFTQTYKFYYGDAWMSISALLFLCDGISRRRILCFGANLTHAANIYPRHHFPRAVPWATEPCRPTACIHWRHVSSWQHQPIDGCAQGIPTHGADAMNRVPTVQRMHSSDKTSVTKPCCCVRWQLRNEVAALV